MMLKSEEKSKYVTPTSKFFEVWKKYGHLFKNSQVVFFFCFVFCFVLFFFLNQKVMGLQN